ncbi:hypothetical protein, partial [Archangium sp.]|uniref:hypothetical protein n=1 Tax=Archangium sp. TaxID=1872627 RepID=UPI002D7648BE
MRATSLLLGLAAILASCSWLRPQRQVPPEEDRTIVFPRFFEHSAIKIGAGEGPYELDGVVLQAILIAARDFLPPPEKDQPCRNRLEAHRYRVIRRGDIIFVQIEDDDEFCGLKYLSLDTGAKYAISIDGRILRRIIGTEPEESEQQDGGVAPAPDGGSPHAPDASLDFGAF